jgi:hypothetical protein
VCPIVVWLLFLTAAEAPAANHGAAGDACQTLKGSAQGQFVSPTTAVTQVQIRIDGQLLGGTSTATIRAQRESHTAILALTTHVFEFAGDGDGVCEAGEDCFRTADDATLWAPASPGSPHLLDAKLRILDGKGRFKRTSGDLRAIGTVNFGTGEVEWEIWGTLNRCGLDD